MKRQQPQISEDRILEVSWELLGELGIEKFSMRRLAERMGIQAPSLYWYVKSKQHLYQRLANQVSAIILTEFKPEGDWRKQLGDLATTVRRILTSYPCSTQMMMLTLPHEPDMIRFTNRLLECVEHTSLRAEQKLQAVTTLMNYVFYFVLDDYQHEQNITAMVNESGATENREMSQLLNALPERDSGLFKRTFEGGLFDLMGTEEAFEFGLRLILLGIEQIIHEEEQAPHT